MLRSPEEAIKAIKELLKVTSMENKCSEVTKEAGKGAAMAQAKIDA
jgi:hypothetical protein